MTHKYLLNHTYITLNLLISRSICECKCFHFSVNEYSLFPRYYHDHPSSGL